MPTTLRLLIVQDQPDEAELAVAVLEEAGYACQWQRVETREAFLRCLQTAAYDVVLADYCLPAFDGMAALELVLEHAPGLPCIFISRTAGEETAIESLKAGATDYVLQHRLTRLVPVVQRALHERDIQRRQSAEQQRRVLEAQLFRARKMASIGTLATGVAHDFSNLLRVMQASIEIMRAELRPHDTLLRTQLANIARAADRAATLTRQMLTFSRHQPVACRTLDLHDTIDHLLMMLRRVLGEDIDVCWRTATEVSPVFADAGQIEQALMHLAVNARDAMPHGGQWLIETRNVTFDAAYCLQHPWARPGQYVHLTVSATGPGMDAETCQRPVEPLCITRDVAGSLGLSVVHSIVQQHDGLLRVHREVGRGTTVSLYLPVAPQDGPAVATAGSAPLYGTDTLLVAEDEDVMRTLAYTALTRLGYTVLLARDGQEAVQLYRAHRERIALLILDVIMPRQGGRETYAQVRAMGSTVPVLFTAGDGADLACLRRGVGADARVLQKPYSIHTLGHTVREILDPLRQRDAVREPVQSFVD